MATLTPVKKSDLVEMGISFISIEVPAFPLNVRKTIVVETMLFDSMEEAKEKLTSLENPLIIFDSEKVYGEKVIQENKKLQDDKFYLRATTEVSLKDWKRIYDNIKNTKDAIYHHEFDLTYYR